MKNFLMNEDGQGMVEYGLILGLIAIVVIAALTATGGSLKSLFGTVGGNVANVTNT
ncbi:MAG TPA: Flp family type IVb pilin [Candidatus Wallbacteria bacterium]|nr:Flp family type IVb pilin [Candidatus Wallbacteria bacterium]